MQSIRRRRECLYPDECWYCIWWFDDSTILYQLRNQAVEKQTKTQYETFNQDKQFSNYLEATKLLTGKKSTT